MTQRRALRSATLVLALIVPSALALWAPAQALPAAQPDSTYMVDGPVYSLVQVQPPGQNLIWIGGKFSHVMKTRKTAVADVNGLAVFDDHTGLPAPIHVPILDKSGGAPTVYDMALSPDGSRLYVAGNFTQVDGQPRTNVAAIDPATGALLSFQAKAQVASSVYATDSQVFVGGVMLTSFDLNGKKTVGYVPPKAIIDPSLRQLNTKATFRGLAREGNTLVAACQCDSVLDRNGLQETKAAVEVDITTGALLPWTPSNMIVDSGAWGSDAIVGNDPISGLPTVYLAAGGSDFTAAYDFATGQQLWKTDTSGSSQVLTMYQGDLIVGGHFWYVESPTAPQCGQNSNPIPGCYHAPRLVALNPVDGSVILDQATQQPWNPGICCIYQGLWALLLDADGTQLHVGGAFKEAGGDWVQDPGTGAWALVNFAKEQYYARFSDLPPTP
jgi:large repetitive protein